MLQKHQLLVFFSATPIEKYGPFGKNKIGINTDKTTINQIIEEINKILSKN